MSLLSQTDPEISHALYMEGKRQRETINLIASENYASRAVLETEGSVMTNEYAESYPQRRYYGGRENMDVVEGLAIQRAILNNALVLATELKQLGLRLVSGGTDNHLVLVDLTEIRVTGREAEETLGRTGIVVNRNSIPFIDTHPPRIASGIRLGTPAMTSRNFGTEKMKHIASLMVKVITNIGNLNIHEQVSQEVSQLCSRFPVPGIDD